MAVCSCARTGLLVGLFLTVASTSFAQTTTVTLNWTDNSPDESHFRIERRNLIGTYVFVANAPASAGIGRRVTFKDTRAALTTSYLYRVRAENATGESAWTQELAVLTGLKITGSGKPLDSSGSESDAATPPLPAPTRPAPPAGGQAPSTPVASVPIDVQPVPMTAKIGSGAYFSVEARGTGLKYQWKKNGAALSGQTNASLYLNSVKATDAGDYSVVVTGGDAASNSQAAKLTVVSKGNSRIIATSVRGYVDRWNDSLVPAVLVGGSGDKRVLIRAIGAELESFGVSSPLGDPVLSVHKFGLFNTGNDNWQTFSDQTALEAARRKVGAFPLTRGSRDAAMLTEFESGVPYTLPIWSRWLKGTALGEVYDLDPLNAGAYFAKVSARALVSTGENILTQGFVVAGDVALTVLIRGIGPGLVPFGVRNGLAQPELKLYRGDGGGSSILVNTNRRWGDAPNLAEIRATFGATGATPLTAGSEDTAMLVALPPGTYTVQLSSETGKPGTGEIEIFVVH